LILSVRSYVFRSYARLAILANLAGALDDAARLQRKNARRTVASAQAQPMSL
jgi:hypothetical protein